MKNAIITGGTKGIGLSISEMLLKEGYFVTATYFHDEKAALECSKRLLEISSQFEIVKVNQSNKVAMHEFAMHMKEKKNIDCLICNAGSTLRTPLKNIDDYDWENLMQVNLNSNVFLIRDLFDEIFNTNNSSIILIGSILGIYPHSVSLAYGVTKAAIHALAKNLVKEFEGSSTNINVIAPGFVETEWQKNKPTEIRNNICNKIAAKRFAYPDEIAHAVKFCLTNSYINGTVIEVNGGYNYK